MNDKTANNNTTADNEHETMQSIEVEAVTVKEAIKIAQKTLNAKKQELSIEVLKEEHKGLFGMEGAELAKIRAKKEKPSR